MKYKHRLLSTLLALSTLATVLTAQHKYTLQECYQAAEQNTPILRNSDLIAAQAVLQQASIQSQRLPRVQLIANGSLQSENITLSFPPNLPLESIELPLYRGQLYAEAQYTIYDGGRLKTSEELVAATSLRQQQNLEVPREEVRQKVLELFFSLQTLEAQQSILESGLKSLHEREKSVQSAVEAGALLEENLLELQVQIMHTESQILQIKQSKSSVRKILSHLTGLSIDEHTQFELPPLPKTLPEEEDFTQRANWQTFAFRQMELNAQIKNAEAMRKPVVAAFGKAGIGYPNPLNFFDDAVSPYGIIGLQLTWQPFDWKVTQRKKEMLQLQSHAILNEQEQLLQQYKSEDIQLRSQLLLFEQQIQKDKALLALQKQLVQKADIQLQEGTITTTDYLAKWNAYQQTEWQLKLHQLQQLQSAYTLQILHNGY